MVKKMCDFFSCIVRKNGEVLFDADVDSHEELKKKFKLDDTKTGELGWLGVELTPTDGSIFSDIATWKIKVHELSSEMVWWNRNAKTFEKKIRDAAAEVYVSRVLAGQKIDTLMQGRYFLKDCDVKALKGSVSIKEMCGSSTVQEMWDSSTVVSNLNSEIEIAKDSSRKTIKHKDIKASKRA
jgi:hypothetical protein